MDINVIKSKLCTYDPRNPNSDIFDAEDLAFHKKEPICYCNSCFNGTHNIADELLKYIEKFGSL